ncbi:putative nitroreductase HBN1 like protein [Verticillium longisporum]|uniref:Putative nitroreductase HBN1 like protein n=1 Tax=Verticillium longisporum TaxID=100787 RepID=A0A8I3AMX3_VERLO|nr:putative nitroreductase HBN1 like protein [Verticillium longisporum]
MSSSLSASTYLSHIENRRSHYPLTKDTPLSAKEVDTIVQTALKATPSSFNSQSNRVVVLHGAHHTKLWSITSDILKAIVPADAWESTKGKMDLFSGAAGTVLFFEDQDVVNGMQQKFAAYADKFPVWANQSDAMLQFSVWTALEAEGFGANLQHYNPLIDEKVAAEWSVPSSWKLNAQLVFGGKTGETGPKDFKPLEETFKSFN